MKIIAELCQNHNGDESTLHEMVREAAEGGATHIKVQNIYVKNLTHRPEFDVGISQNTEIKIIKRPFDAEYERLKTLELDDKILKNFIELCKGHDVVPLTTCFARDDVSHARQLGFEEIKVASYDCASYQLLRELKDNFRHVYISTGATFDDEIRTAARVFHDCREKFSFLHCVTKYPTQLSDFNLARLEFLKQHSNEVGLSDHSLVSRDGVFATKCAIYLGATIIERHFTILAEDKTKDGPVSITPKLLDEIRLFCLKDKSGQKKELDSVLRNWEAILMGDEQRVLSHEELLNRAYFRGRFASPRIMGKNDSSNMIFNWEETALHD